MVKGMLGLLSGLLLSPMTLAEPPAVYRDGILTIPGGALIDESGATFYYRNIQLQGDATGGFQVIAAQPAELAEVTAAQVIVEGGEAEAVVQGTKSACVSILEPAISYDDGIFLAVLPESEPISDTCILVLENFETRFALPVSGLESGSYTLLVNGLSAEFQL